MSCERYTLGEVIGAIRASEPILPCGAALTIFKASNKRMEAGFRFGLAIRIIRMRRILSTGRPKSFWRTAIWVASIVSRQTGHSSGYEPTSEPMAVGMQAGERVKT